MTETVGSEWHDRECGFRVGGGGGHCLMPMQSVCHCRSQKHAKVLPPSNKHTCISIVAQATMTTIISLSTVIGLVSKRKFVQVNEHYSVP